LGRAQELCILLENYWDRMGLSVPVYFSAGMTQKANHYYRLYANWTSTTLKQPASRNMFDFKHIKPFDMSFADLPGPMVLFASPGMLHAGTSLSVFRKWAPDPANMVILPGYCVPGTVGARVLAREKEIDVEGGKKIMVNLQVEYLSFSAHADARGIHTLIRQCRPLNVVLVHGEAGGMETLKPEIESVHGIACHNPPNGGTVCIEPSNDVHIEVSQRLAQQSFSQSGDSQKYGVVQESQFEAVLHLQPYQSPQLLHSSEAYAMLKP
jgi:integrator complex subunit 11